MAALFKNKLILPIGCSCINQFQIRLSAKFTGGRDAVYPLDWAITTPDATIDILSHPAPFIHTLTDLEIKHGRVRSVTHPGIYFWHINSDLQRDSMYFQNLSELAPGIDFIVEKHHYMMKKLTVKVDEVHCLWSNIQPNLKSAVDGLEAWDSFHLTTQRYYAIKERCNALPANKISVSFICRADDIDPPLCTKEDVFILECPRSPDYQGAPGLFDPIFDKILR